MIDKLINQIERQYDPDYDLPESGPQVTYIDYALLSLIKLQQDRIERLEAAVEQLRRSGAKVARQ